MKTILKYLRWLWAHSVGARGAVLLNILLGTVNVGLNLYFIWLCKRLVDIATGAAADTPNFSSIAFTSSFSSSTVIDSTAAIISS